MGGGLWLHPSERHEHDHAYEDVDHEHRHVHESNTSTITAAAMLPESGTPTGIITRRCGTGICMIRTWIIGMGKLTLGSE